MGLRENWIEQVDSKESVVVNTKGGYSFEQVMWNKNTSKEAKYWYRIEGTERFLFRSSVAESWEFILPTVKNPIRNMQQIYLYFKDVSQFIIPNRFYTANGFYTRAVKGSVAYENYWDKEEEYIHTGKIVDGVRITPRHYFMLNYGRMRAKEIREDGSESKRKKITAPSFVDMQYYVSHEYERWLVDLLYSSKRRFLEWFPLATESDFEYVKPKAGALPKARRKGFTAINGISLLAYNFAWVPESYNMIGAYQEKFYSVVLGDAVEPTLNWLNSQTPWVRRRLIDQSSKFESGYEEENEYGIKVTKGYKSMIEAITYHSTAFAGIGKSADLVFIEEAGKFNNLLDVWGISIEPLIKDGDEPIGAAVIGGTAGEMGDDGTGGSQALAYIAYNPEAMGLASYENIYDENPQGNSSLFIDALWYYPLNYPKRFILDLCTNEEERRYIGMMFRDDKVSGVDSQGNSHRLVAELVIKKNRAIKKAGGLKAYNNYITQYPLTLSEAFLVSVTSPFDKALAKEAQAHLAVSREPLAAGYFTKTPEGGIKWVLDFSKHPIAKYPNDTDEEEGCWVLYELPRKAISNSSLQYIVGMDPIDKGYEEASSDNKHSLASSFIMNTFTGNIVAEYTGRPGRAKQYFTQAALGFQYYGAKVMYENNLTGFFQYCATNKLMSLLADEPSILKGRAGYKMGKVGTKGFHATAEVNRWLIETLASWLEEDVFVGQDPATGAPIYTSRYFTIPSMGLLQEIEKWSLKGNFDRISAMGALMLFYEQTGHAREHEMKQAEKKNVGELQKRFRKKYMSNGE